MNLKALAVNIAIPLAAGAVSGLLAGGGMEKYASLEQPALSLPGAVFPAVWSVLYILMGISSYQIWESRDPGRASALRLYGVQLAVNAAWPLLFFLMGWFLTAFFWLLLLIFLAAWMVFRFRSVKKSAAYLQIPYLLWLIFAGYLNLGVYLLNR